MQPYIQYVAFALLGALISWIIQRVANRKRYMRYTVTTSTVGFSSQDDIFGHIRVIWNDVELTSVHFSVVRIENTCGRDLEDFTFAVWSRAETEMLIDAKFIVGSANIFGWSDKFGNLIAVPEGGTASPQQIHAWRHNREYTVPVFNRHELIEVQVLSTASEAQKHALYVDTRTKGIQMRYQVPVTSIHGVPISVTLPLGIILSALLTWAFVLFHFSASVIAIAALAAGLFSQSIAAIAYKAVRFLLKPLR
jgi:hypothetical protein